MLKNWSDVYTGKQEAALIKKVMLELDDLLKSPEINDLLPDIFISLGKPTSNGDQLVLVSGEIALASAKGDVYKLKIARDDWPALIKKHCVASGEAASICGKLREEV